MSIQAGIRTPGMYTDVNINTQRTGLPANTHKVLFITSDVPSDQLESPVSVYNQVDADRYFGAGSIAGRMLKAAIKTNNLVSVECFGGMEGGDNNQDDDSPQPNLSISCAGATTNAILQGLPIMGGFTKEITVDVYVNNVLVASDVIATYINQSWYNNGALQDNASQTGYSVSGTSSNQEIFHNSSDKPITFSFVPKSDGVYEGETYFAKDALLIYASNDNPTAYKDPETGVVSFCLAAST